MALVRSPLATRRFVPIDQPIGFDHRHHVRDDGIDCAYCHVDAARSAWAGIPSTDVCMGCHSQIWSDAPALEPVRASAFRGVPITWKAVNSLPDFVFFRHDAHVTAGIDCAECHGDVDQMAKVYAASDLQMGWCLGCHRDPRWADPPPDDCVTCHR
jgi:hypothetical protein